MTEFTVRLTSLVYGGDALGRLPDGRVAFVPFALPGETVRVRLLEEKRAFVRGELLEVLQPSGERIAPCCAHFGTCGGCHYQHLSYQAQQAAKNAIVREQLQRIGGLVDPPVQALAPSPEAFYYRNYVQFHLTSDGRLGYNRSRTEQVFAIQVCHLPEAPLNHLWPQLDFEAVPGLERIGLRLGAGEDVQLILESNDPEPPEFSVEE